MPLLIKPILTYSIGVLVASSKTIASIVTNCWENESNEKQTVINSKKKLVMIFFKRLHKTH
jgi:hypothetical protein